MEEEIKKSEPIKGELLSIPQSIKAAESAIGGVSIRGIIALVLVVAVVVYPFCSITVPEVVSNLAIAAVSYYFGKSQSK